MGLDEQNAIQGETPADRPSSEGRFAAPADAQIEQVAFADLYISDLNPRKIIDEASIEVLAENIRQLGLIQNLAGLRDAGGKVGIVAGGRRYRALALLQDEPQFQTVPVVLAPDEATAKVWASAENHVRVQPHPAEEIDEYAALHEQGIPLTSIAIAFGVTEAHVKRRLKLAVLPKPVLKALRANEISLGKAACFTICDDEKLCLEVLERARGDDWLNEARIRQMLKPQTVKATDRKALFVGVDAYTEAGGRLSHDLFAEETYFDDPAILEACFSEALSEAARRLQIEEGWKWVDSLDESYLSYDFQSTHKLGRVYPEEGQLSEEQAERYDELAELANADVLDEDGGQELAALEAILEGTFNEVQKALAGAFVHVDTSGELSVSRGFIRHEDVPAAISAGIVQETLHAKPEKDPKAFSAKLAEDLARVATGARQTAILKDPELVLSLLAFQLSGGTGYYSAIGLRANDVPNWPTSGDDGYDLDPQLKTPSEHAGQATRDDLGKAFRAFQKKGEDHVRDELVRHLAALLFVSNAKLAGLIDRSVKTNIRDVWTPTAENFLSRVSGTYLDTLWQELLDVVAEHPSVTTFARLKKSEKVQKLHDIFNDVEFRAAHGITKKQEGKIAKWLPEGMA